MIALATVFFVVLVSQLITRVASIALSLTGMSTESARFQARSAFFGVGFTTGEAEAVVNHPVRRRIIMSLILLGNAGIVTVLGTLLISFAGDRGSFPVKSVAILVAGVAVLGALSVSRPVDRLLTRVIRRSLARWTDLDARDYSGLLELGDGYAVAELEVEPQDWIAGRTLAEITLRDEGVVVLGVRKRSGGYIGAPDGHTCIEPEDVLTVYGREDRVEELDRRRHDQSGDRAHRDAIAEQERLEAAGARDRD
jgi:TrkA family protein